MFGWQKINRKGDRREKSSSSKKREKARLPTGAGQPPQPGAAHPAPARLLPSERQELPGQPQTRSCGPSVSPARPTPGAELRTPRASRGCEAGAAASPASLPLPRPAGSIRITSWSKYAGQPENQSRHNQRLVNCNVAETHPSHPLLSPLSPPQPSAFRTIKDSIIGERKI